MDAALKSPLQKLAPDNMSDSTKQISPPRREQQMVQCLQWHIVYTLALLLFLCGMAVLFREMAIRDDENAEYFFRGVVVMYLCGTVNEWLRSKALNVAGEATARKKS